MLADNFLSAREHAPAAWNLTLLYDRDMTVPCDSHDHSLISSPRQRGSSSRLLVQKHAAPMPRRAAW